MSLTGDKSVPVLWLDIDGTVRHGYAELGRFVNTASDVVVFPEAVDRMKAWKAGGGRIVGVTNQGGIATGKVKETAVMKALARTNELCGYAFDKIAYCRHHPDADHPEMARCWCRKPAPGLVIETAYSMSERHRGEIYPPYMGLFVGDRDEDRECARIASIDFQLASEWRASL